MMFMGGKAKAFGVLFALYSVICFTVNFGIWKPFLVGDFAVLWNPLILVTGDIAGGIPIIGGALGSLFNAGVALFWSGCFFLFGSFLVIK
jgi:hypothetical protein